MPGLVDYVAGVGKTWVSDFTGPGIIFQWGGGGGGASGTSLTNGGRGGGSGALAVDLQQFTTGQTYTYTNGAGGVGGVYPIGDDDNPGQDGQPSSFGGGTTCRAAGGQGGGSDLTLGAGGSLNDCLGRSRISGGDGQDPPGANLFRGGDGGDAPGQGDYSGGTGGTGPGSGAGDDGNSPGGGGSGGAQDSNGVGGDGAPGGTIVIPAPDSSLPGYYIVGYSDAFVFDPAGSYDDFEAEGHGIALFENVGGGGGGRPGGVSAGLQPGGHGGGGGAYAATLREVFKNVFYRRVVGAGGTGGVYNTNTVGGKGGDSSWTLTPMQVNQKGLASNVATIRTCRTGDSTSMPHGLLVGDSVTITNVDATFNGTHTVTAVSADRLTFSFAKTAANVTTVAVTPGTTSVALTNVFCKAEGGYGATGNGTSGTAQPGGLVANCIGDIKAAGGYGLKVAVSTTTNGANGGSAALPLGDIGGWGGNSVIAAGRAGDPGFIPGGGGGGGQNFSGGNGAVGAIGAAVVKYILELHGIWVSGERKSVTRVTVWTGSPGSEVANNVLESSIWDGGLKRSTQAILEHPESGKRRLPPYLIGSGYDYTSFFDRDSCTFNWKAGVGTAILDAIAANDLDMVWPGDSVSEGWTSFDGLLTGVKNFPKAFPRIARDTLAAATNLSKGGTGFIRPNTVSGADPMWSKGSWSDSGDKHYLSSSNTGHIATFTPGLDSEGVQLVGNRVAVVYSGTGGITLRIGGSIVATGPGTASTAVFNRLEYSPGSTAAHVLDIRPTSGVSTLLLGADVYTDSGIKCHNIGQGGSKAAGAAAQGIWGPPSGMTAPGNMTACYSQTVLTRSGKSGRPDVVCIFLGGNDSNSGISAADIKAAYKRIGQAWAHADTKIILVPDVWTADRILALMDLCIEEDWAMIDFYYYSRALTEIFAGGYNGDVFGHLNATTGAQWAAASVHNAFLYEA